MTFIKKKSQIKFKTNKKYRHKNCIDVDIKILDIHLEDKSLIILKILWLNRNWLNGEFIINNDIIKIRKEHYKNWDEIA